MCKEVKQEEKRAQNIEFMIKSKIGHGILLYLCAVFSGKNNES